MRLNPNYWRKLYFVPCRNTTARRTAALLRKATSLPIHTCEIATVPTAASRHPQNTFFFVLIGESALTTITDQLQNAVRAIDRSRCGFALIADHAALRILPRPAVDSWFGRIDPSGLAKEVDAFLTCIFAGRVWASPQDLVSLLGDDQIATLQRYPEIASGEPALPLRRLTKRQSEVARLVAEGAANRAIAEKLGIGLYTVKSHVSAAMAAFEVTNRTELAVQIRRSVESVPRAVAAHDSDARSGNRDRLL